MTPLAAGLDVCARRLSGDASGPVAVAYSGGGDSLALLLVARAWARASGRPLLALHVDHGLQPLSADWAAQARAQAARLGAPLTVLTWRGDKPSAGLPAAARAARHVLIGEAARAAGARVILLGHTLDDQLENALMRGAGVPVGALREWSASPAWPQGRGLFHCRPLLTMRRAVLRDWLRTEGLDWVEDPANGDLRYARARARQGIDQGAAPEDLGPAVDLADLARACRLTAWGAIEIDRGALRSAPVDQARRLLQIALACASGAPSLARPGRARDLLHRLNEPGDFVAGLAGARVIAADAVRLVREAGEGARGGLRPLELQPGQTRVWDGRWEVQAGAADVRVGALAGSAARLAAADKVVLRAICASDRPSLPLLHDAAGHVRLARLAMSAHEDHKDGVGASVRMLVTARFQAACGLIRREDEIGTNVRMAKSHPSSYVGAEGRD